MKQFLPVLKKDFYKVGHPAQYEPGTSLIYSNLTPRGSRIPGTDGVIVFGPQYFVRDTLIDQFRANFFWQPREKVMTAYKRRIDSALGPGTNINHIGELHENGWLPLHIKALPEGTLCPFRVPVLTLYNTDPKFYWLTNMVETMLSNALWRAMTSATTAFGYRQVFERYAQETGADPSFIKWQGHDFSCRGLDEESSIISGAAHLLSFTGTDTILAIDFLEEYYGANSDKELVGGSVPATEHSVMCMGQQDGELSTFARLIRETYPEGIVSIVSDTWDFWKVLTKYLPALKPQIMARMGKVVIRPDSGDPVKIICGDPDATKVCERIGAIAVLWDVFGGRVNAAGYRELDPHIGLIYGDSITPERQTQILEGLKALGFASSNVVLGIGSYTYQYVTRDTYGFAMKATYGEHKLHGPRPIFKDPKTDSGVKKSAKGLLTVWNDIKDIGIYCEEDVDWHLEGGGMLQTIFRNGIPENIQTLAQIRARVESHL